MSTTITEQVLTRARLSADYRIAAAYGGALAPSYAHARNAQPQGTILDAAADVQAEVDHVCGLYARQRHFATIVVRWGSYRLRQCITVRYPRYGLDAGVPAIIRAIARDHVNRTITLALWY